MFPSLPLPREAAMGIRSVRSIVANQTPLTAPRSTTVLEAAHQMKAQGKGAP